MRLAYADPPYLGCCDRYTHHHQVPYGCWDDPDTHQALVDRLCDEFEDGWAMSASAPSLRTIWPMCPEDSRVAVWTKTFAVFKPNVNPGYCWEPVIWWRGRKGGRDVATVRDWFTGPITLRKGLIGAKPEFFCRAVLNLLGYVEGDELVDLFPGTGVLGRVAAQGVFRV